MKTTTITQIKYAIEAFNRAELNLRNAINNEFQYENEDLAAELEKICENTQIIVESLIELVQEY